PPPGSLVDYRSAGPPPFSGGYIKPHDASISGRAYIPVLVASLRPIHEQERAALSATFASLGPAAPTLCEDWNVAQLAAHLVASQRLPGLALATFFYPLLRVMPGAMGRRSLRSGQRVGLRQLASVGRRGWVWRLGRPA